MEFQVTETERKKAARELGRRGGVAAARNMTRDERVARSKAAHAGRAKKKEQRLAAQAAAQEQG